MGADAAGAAIRVDVACAATSSGCSSAPQLADGKGSGAQDGGNDGCEQRSLGNLSQHGSYSFRLEGCMIFTSAESGLACAREPFDFTEGGIVEHTGPDFLDLPRRVNQDGLRRELKPVVDRRLRVHLLKHGKPGKLVLLNKDFAGTGGHIHSYRAD